MIRILIADDSAAIRGIMRKMMDGQPDIEIIGTASNGLTAISEYERLKPDLLTLDVEMPEMDGIDALQGILKADPDARVIMCSSLTLAGANTTLKALEIGARDYIPKPSNDSIFSGPAEFQRQLLEKIRALAKRPPQTIAPANTPAPAIKTDDPISLRPAPVNFHKADIIAIGSSTGGVQAILNVLEPIAKSINVPVVITQHMPPTFVAMLATHIEQKCGLHACEATEGMKIEPGKVYLAPGGRHLEIIDQGNGPIASIIDTPPENYCKPSVEPMIRSLLNVYKKNILAVILTGMGNDGHQAAGQLAEAGTHFLIAQDEASSVVWGMPGAVARAGYCNAVLPLDKIPDAMRKYLS